MQMLDLSGKRVLVRVDFNVPLDKEHNITDDARIREVIPTLKYILSQPNTSIVLLSHLGRPLKKLLPDGSIDRETFSLKHVVERLSQLLGIKVKFIDDCIGTSVTSAVNNLSAGEVILLENTRFYPEEEKGDPDFSAKLAKLGDVYVNDAFGTAHRAHASTCIIANSFSRDKKGFGLLMNRELNSAKKLLLNPERPFTAIVGGAKVSDKILLLERLIDIVDNILIGGGMTYTFIKAQGGQIGNSLVEEDRLDIARKILKKAEGKIKFLLPQDSVIADKFDNSANTQIVESNKIPDGWMGLDIGPKSIVDFKNVISASKSILWNGPMGVFEMSNFSAGTREIATEIAHQTSEGAFSLIGGGDSAAAINQMGLVNDVSFVSTGGGAMLELLEGKVLPGVQAILQS